MIYLDYNATAPMRPAVREAMLAQMLRTGNPSSVHAAGRAARQAVEAARAKVAMFVHAAPEQVVFTSCGTEANNLAFNVFDVAGYAVSSIEHDSVLMARDNAAFLPVTADGVLDLEKSSSIIDTLPVPSLVSVMLVNNETGVIQPVESLAAYAKARGHKVHVDAVQAAGRLPLDMSKLGADMLTLSAHKIGGPQGVGALILPKDLPPRPLLRGGGQEKRWRSGTENVAGIVGFGVAVEEVRDGDEKRLISLRDRLQQGLVQLGGDRIFVVGEGAPRVGGVLCAAVRGVPASTQVMVLDLAGIAVSAGSACSSGKVKESHVLKAMNLPSDVVGSAVRYSLGYATTEQDIETCLSALKNNVLNII